MTDLNNYLGNKLTIEYGGISKDNLLNRLRKSGIMLNEFAEIIFSSEFFKTSKEKRSCSIIETTIKDIDFPNGATMTEIKERTNEIGLFECPLELGPYLRLKYIDQKEVKEDTNNRKNLNPAGSLTIFSKPLIEDDNFPKGFYLRKIDEKLWLRGYRCSMDYLWMPSDRLVFKIN